MSTEDHSWKREKVDGQYAAVCSCGWTGQRYDRFGRNRDRMGREALRHIKRTQEVEDD